MRCYVLQKPFFTSAHVLRGNDVIFVDNYFAKCRIPRGKQLYALKMRTITYIDNILINIPLNLSLHLLYGRWSQGSIITIFLHSTAQENDSKNRKASQ